MTLPSLLPLAGAAIAPVLGKVIESVSERLSFLDVLHKQEQSGEAEEVQSVKTSTLESEFAELADRLRERLSPFGIDLSTPLRLKQDGRDRIVVEGDHPDRVLIEGIIGSDEGLASLFNEVAKSATSSRQETKRGITGEFQIVLRPTDASIEFA
ncbi:MAG: hypothetical protein H8E66_04230 [Planctomycetes bacterium]|nr:hypothetical protein [Planctomycetota bacterium]